MNKNLGIIEQQIQGHQVCDFETTFLNCPTYSDAAPDAVVVLLGEMANTIVNRTDTAEAKIEQAAPLTNRIKEMDALTLELAESKSL